MPSLPRPAGYRGPWNPRPSSRALARATHRAHYGPLGPLTRAYVARVAEAALSVRVAEREADYQAIAAALPPEEREWARDRFESIYLLPAGEVDRILGEAAAHAEDEVAGIVARASTSYARGVLRAWIAGPVALDGDRRL